MGIYRSRMLEFRPFGRLPHAGGDIPTLEKMLDALTEAAPRRWGYTPGYTLLNGQAREGLPLTGGDIPWRRPYSVSFDQAAPRRWGYTWASYWTRSTFSGCPTQVGIFLFIFRFPLFCVRLPHAGNGMSSDRDSLRMIDRLH